MLIRNQTKNQLFIVDNCKAIYVFKTFNSNSNSFSIYIDDKRLGDFDKERATEILNEIYEAYASGKLVYQIPEK